MLQKAVPLLFLIISNMFMTYAWYGHLKKLGNRPFYIAILVSWCVAFFEYCFQVPGNRLGFKVYTLPQLKIIQEVITMCVFAGFCCVVMKERLSLNFLYAALCMTGAVYFIFRG